VTDITQVVGPAVEVRVKLKLPAAFLKYIQEVAIKEKKWNKDLDSFCSDELIRVMIAELDGDEKMALKNYTIPKAIA
jgi:hypothetical protein